MLYEGTLSCSFLLPNCDVKQTCQKKLRYCTVLALGGLAPQPFGGGGGGGQSAGTQEAQSFHRPAAANTRPDNNQKNTATGQR
jgi:hypothetical protein